MPADPSVFAQFVASKVIYKNVSRQDSNPVHRLRVGQCHAVWTRCTKSPRRRGSGQCPANAWGILDQIGCWRRTPLSVGYRFNLLGNNFSSYTCSLSKILSATSQVVSGFKNDYSVELIDNQGATKVCQVDIWSQSWLPNGIQVTFRCPNEPELVRKHDA